MFPHEVAPPPVLAGCSAASAEDRAQRSRALFVEASQVMLHPRCANCHPAGDSPLQGERGQLHDPPVQRGPESHGIVGLECTSCHQDHNLEAGARARCSQVGAGAAG